ncbi:putative capsular polysaccharide synthesis family protein [Thalassotalea castellviae]|uniref:Capsular polysaccharide synthesis family protein n=1 Tax=Thalassotalea castellviae TaxID=3075612 RepID=A0ABU2ZYM2_9GAMM|nr:putative capsular polysaccharide synthesis family protein [Thalassotalea sp. W431]MDT0602804.1 putative capsular polysaccharide synthesis family protein [Thalassotalea sp. W431]
MKRYIKRQLKKCQRYADPNTIFIYQMGKVGSTTLENAIAGSLHIHAFYSKNSTCVIRQKGLNKFGFRAIFYTLEREISDFIHRIIFKRRAHTKIITLVREPIARNQSMFFHDIDAYLFSVHTNCLNTRRTPLPTRSQPKLLLEKVFNEEFDHFYPLNWFDKEFKPMTGVDIYSKAFNKELGYSLIDNKGVSVLCISIDKLDDLTSVIEEFIGHKLVLLKDNNSENKWYSELYKQFRQHYQLPSNIEKTIKISKFYQHFF